MAIKEETIETKHEPEDFKHNFLENLHRVQGKLISTATMQDLYMALAYTVRDRMIYRWLQNAERFLFGEKGIKLVAYLSAEFLLGPHLINNLICMGIYDEIKKEMEEAHLPFDQIVQQEEEPGLGNGGLGRLAACFMDSLSTLHIPAIGYGIRYEFGIFNQLIQEGWQVEKGDKWLFHGNPWELARPQISVEVNFGGYTEAYKDEKGKEHTRWIAEKVVRGVPYDTPMLGYKTQFPNMLRLWKAEAHESFDFQAFNKGDYVHAVSEKIDSETISKVLYPNDEPSQGKRLRLEQQYFFVSCSLQDMIRIHFIKTKNIETLCEDFTAQLNDTHPSIAIAEMMRLLVDVYYLEWEKAWEITKKIFAYTNHTLLPEALEKWPVDLFKELLPRPLEIIYEINKRFLNEVALIYPGNLDKLSRLSLIEEGDKKFVRMAHLACVGSHAINGVAAIHTQLLKEFVLKDFYELNPSKFKSITNGVTPRRWIGVANPRLAELLNSTIGTQWITNLDELKKLETFAHDTSFCEKWAQIKLANKTDFAKQLEKCNPYSLFDVQAKRIHEYKRQHLNVLHIITLYHRLKKNPSLDIPPRTFLFGGKAAPSYFLAKLIIKLINSVAECVNNDPAIQEKIKIYFIPNFNVKTAQKLYPVADLSEQISTAGKEASGTGNMKFSFNGALTIGTLDGANIEIRESVGRENFFLFGLTVCQILEMQAKGYHPWEYYHSNPALKEAIDSISSGLFSKGDTQLFKPLVDSLLTHDPFMVMADYESYVECQERVSQLFRNPQEWVRMSILNVARMGFFSSDRAIKEYCDTIWHVKPMLAKNEPFSKK